MGVYRAQVWAKTNGVCWYCGKQMNPFEDFEEEHQDPKIQGGSDELANLQPACSRCNRRKKGRTVEEYRKYLAGKGELRFWGELQPLSPSPEAEPMRFSKDKQTIRDIQQLIKACLDMSFSHGEELTILFLELIRRIEFWYVGEDCVGSGCGEFVLEDFSLETGLPIKLLMMTFLCLEEHKVINFYHYDSDGKRYHFSLDFDEVLYLGSHPSIKRLVPKNTSPPQ